MVKQVLIADRGASIGDGDLSAGKADREKIARFAEKKKERERARRAAQHFSTHLGLPHLERRLTFAQGNAFHAQALRVALAPLLAQLRGGQQRTAARALALWQQCPRRRARWSSREAA